MTSLSEYRSWEIRQTLNGIRDDEPFSQRMFHSREQRLTVGEIKDMLEDIERLRDLED